VIPESYQTLQKTITRKQMIWTAVAVAVVLLYMNPWIIRSLVSPFMPKHTVTVVRPAAAAVLAPTPPVVPYPPIPAPLLDSAPQCSCSGSICLGFNFSALRSISRST
jgi:hypothetical protein